MNVQCPSISNCNMAVDDTTGLDLKSYKNWALAYVFRGSSSCGAAAHQRDKNATVGTGFYLSAAGTNFGREKSRPYDQHFVLFSMELKDHVLD